MYSIEFNVETSMWDVVGYGWKGVRLPASGFSFESKYDAWDLAQSINADKSS